MEIEVVWEGGQRFRADAPDGAIVVDGEAGAGLSPVQTLLVAVATCMGVDIVDILQKGRQDVTGCSIRIDAARRDDPPRRLTAVRMAVVLAGRGLGRAKAERAVELSRTTYCSVWNSLAPDIRLEVEIDLREGDGPRSRSG